MKHKYCIVCYDVIQAVEQVLCLNCYERFQESKQTYAIWLITRKSTAEEMMINVRRDGKLETLHQTEQCDCIYRNDKLDTYV